MQGHFAKSRRASSRGAWAWASTQPAQGEEGGGKGEEKEDEEGQWGSSGVTGPGYSPLGLELLTRDLTDLNNP